MKILIDPGHGGKYPGAVNERLGIKESSVTLVYSMAIHDRLVKSGHRAKLTRVDDVHFSPVLAEDLRDRVVIANVWKPDLFLSVHCNASEAVNANGIEVWTSPGETASDAAATAIYNAVLTAFPHKNFRKDMSDGDPDKESAFYVLAKTKCPAVLIELGFISNDMEAEWLDTDKTVKEYAAAIAMGIEMWWAGCNVGEMSTNVKLT